MKLRTDRNLKSILILMKKLSSLNPQESASKDSSERLGNDLIGVPSRVFQATDLFSDASEIGIVHDGSMYRLRVTRAGKLILTK